MKSKVLKILVVLFIVAVGAGSYRIYTGGGIFADSIRIFVTYYKPLETSYRALANSRYMVPIQVGRAIEGEPFMGGGLSANDIDWLHERMIGDDTGENISAKNREFDVLTAYWWVWKHYKEIGNPRYIGFFAHRKWLTVNLRGIQYVGISDDVSAKAYLEILKKHKVIAYRWEGGDFVWNLYEKNHVISDLEKMAEIIRRKYPEMAGAMFKVLYGGETNLPVFNFWIMEKELAFDYFEKLFYVISELEKDIGDEVRKRDLKQRRAFGYLAERFYGIWLEWQMRTGKVNPYFSGFQWW